MKGKVLIVVLVIALLLGAAAVAVFGFWLPYRNAESHMIQGQLELRELDDGQLQLTWPQATNLDRYLLEIRETGNMEQPYVYYRVFTADNTWKLPPLPTDKALTFSIRTVVDYQQLWLEKERLSEDELALNITLTPPTLQGTGRTKTASGRKCRTPIRPSWFCPSVTRENFLCRPSVS